ncbi:MAG: hypothetical protein JKY89_08410 [Immundisolibacteraceae bacterium]|nr:hypothetical protein [Immundisolibacteraceae bacterium]
MSSGLPENFKHLEPYQGWAHSTEDGRMRQRLEATMDEITDYYRALLPEVNNIANHLQQWPLDAIPAAQKPLLFMALMFMETAMCVEFFHEPDVPEALGAEHIEIYAGRAEQLVNQSG